MIMWVVAALLAQETPVRTKEADDLRARALVEPDGGGRLKVSLDGTVLYEGPGAKAAVDVIAVEKMGRFVTVAVDGDEQVRLLARSLAKPVKLPPAEPPDDGFLRVITEDAEMRVQLVTRSGGEPSEIFAGPVTLGKPQLFGRGDSMEVKIGETAIYRARRPKPTARKGVSVAEIVERLNVHRRAAGVPELKVRADLSRACDLHALYLAKNVGREEVKGLRAHSEDPSLPGWTEEGARAGKASVIHQFGGRKDLVGAVDGLVATLYHRVLMLDVQLVETGVGWAFDGDGAAVVVIHTGTTAGPWREEPVVYPGAGQKDVPLEFALGGRETPDPVPEARAQGGYPVTIQFGWNPTEASMRVTLDGKDVEGWFSTPQSPARGDTPQPRILCWIAKKPLEPGKTYAVEAKAKKGTEPWAKAWSFSTARK